MAQDQVYVDPKSSLSAKRLQQRQLTSPLDVTSQQSDKAAQLARQNMSTRTTMTNDRLNGASCNPTSDLVFGSQPRMQR